VLARRKIQLQNEDAMTDTTAPAPQRPKPGQVVERDGQRYVIDKVLPEV
jgi:hypothetical protein